MRDDISIQNARSPPHPPKIRNHSQVEGSLDRHGWSANKLWNVATHHSRTVWEQTGEIPDHGDLRDELNCAGEKTTVTASNAACTCVRSAMVRSTPR